ncbi:MAG: mechanosensitive ion channel family protein [Rhodospirillaceae bacterium]|nr:MAG: mechanosensitive ion channel family protein [Rhodospirillaceae bacterium]
MDEQLKTLDQVKHTLIDLALKFGPRVLVAFAFFVAGIFVSNWVGRLTDGGLKKFHLEPPVRQLLVRVVRIFVIGLFTILAVQNLGIELLPLIAGLGIAGAGVALAMQGVLGNMVAGLTVIFTRPFSVGEYISITGEEGQVESISIFNTVLIHADLSRVVIPNRKIVGEILHNYGRVRQLEVVVTVAYDADLNGALSALSGVLRDSSLTLDDPAPVIAVSMLRPSAIDIAVKPWVSVADYGTAGSEVRKAIVEKFRSQNIANPIPLQEVRLLGNPASDRG